MRTSAGDSARVGGDTCVTPGIPRARFTLLFLFGLAALLLCADPTVASDAPGRSSIPAADFTLGKSLDLIVVAVVCLLAVGLWLLTRAIPGWGTCVMIIVTLPIVEEFLFRYLLTGVLGIDHQWVMLVARLFGVSPRPVVLVEALVYFGVFFGILHLFMALLPKGPFGGPPGMQVGEGLFIGMFNGLIMINFLYVYGMGLLITMIYVWLAHIMINLALVAFNLVVNFCFGGSILIHAAPRFVLAVTAIFWFVWCWTHNTVQTGIF